MAAKKTKKKAGKSAAQKASSKAGYDLAVAMLKRNKDVEYSAVKDAADRKGLSIYPIVYGRAKAALGLVAVSKRGEGKAKRAAAKKAGASVGRPRGRPRKVAAAAAGMSGLDAIVSQIRDTERERDRAVQTLQKIRALIDSAM